MSTRIFDQMTVLRSDELLPGDPARIELLTAANVGPALETMLSCMDWLDGRTRLVLERDGTILAAGLHASKWLARTDCLVVFDRRLQANTSAAQAKLDLLLAVDVGAIEAQILLRRTSNGHCILRAAGLCRQALVLTVQLAHEGFRQRLANLEEAFGLTPSEAQIVELLHQGHAPQEIGVELGISVHTVRAHLRHCYDKLGVSSREELWQRLAPYRLN